MNLWHRHFSVSYQTLSGTRRIRGVELRRFGRRASVAAFRVKGRGTNRDNRRRKVVSAATDIVRMGIIDVMPDGGATSDVLSSHRPRSSGNSKLTGLPPNVPLTCLEGSRSAVLSFERFLC
jgi:hypothetical protein